MNEIDVIDLNDRFFRIRNEVLEQGLTLAELATYCCLSKFSNNKSRKSFPSISRIAEILNVSRPTIIKAIKGLKEKSLIAIEEGGRGKHNTYYLVKIESGKNILPVKNIDRGSKNILPVVVKNIDSIKTKDKNLNNKTNILYTCQFDFVSAWNSVPDITPVKLLTPKRKTKINTRLANDPDFIKHFRYALTKIETSDFLNGRVSNWKITFDWLIENDTNYIKVCEGNYDGKANKKDDKQAYIDFINRHKED